jgi:hypothetical protein
MKTLKGSELPYSTQREVLRCFVHRYTAEHVPSWARGELKDGKPYPVQFASDKDWLENTLFQVTKAGNLSNRHSYCESHPTWPDNPELRSNSARS